MGKKIKPKKNEKTHRIDHKTGMTKPILRGWIHTIATPLSLAASIVLVILAPTTGRKWACVVYMLASLVLFTMSAIYHQGSWDEGQDKVLRRFDHANIFLLIAGTYTPIAVSCLSFNSARNLLLIVWIGSVLGILGRVFWVNSPRWLYTPIYVVLGWVAVIYLNEINNNAGPTVLWLLIAGGLCYTIGAVVYGFKWPNPSERVFGFHEIFHLATVAAWSCHCVSAYLSVLYV